MTTKFQSVLWEHKFCACLYHTAEEWARHVEDAVNNAGLKVVDAYWPEEPS